MDTKKLLVVILTVVGERLSSIENCEYSDDLETKLKMCKAGTEYVGLQSKINEFMMNNMQIDESLIRDNIQISPAFQSFINDSYIETMRDLGAKNNVLKSMINNLFYQDTVSTLRKNMGPSRVTYHTYDKKKIYDILINATKEQRQSLGITEREIEVIKNARLLIDDIEEIDGYSNDKLSEYESIFGIEDEDGISRLPNEFFKSKSISTEDLEILDNLYFRLMKADENALKKLDLDVLLYSFFGRDTFSEVFPSKNTYDNIANFIINNFETFLFDKKIVEEINRQLGFTFITTDKNAKDVLEMFTLPLINTNNDITFGFNGLMERLNELSLLTKVYEKYGKEGINRIKKLDRSVYDNFYKVIINNSSDDLMVRSDDERAFLKGAYGNPEKLAREDSEDILEINKNVFNILFGIQNIQKRNPLLDGDKIEAILLDIANPNGTFYGLSDSELAVVIIDYFCYYNSSKIVSEKETEAFKNISPLVESIIDSRNELSPIRIVREFATATTEFKEKDDNTIRN